MQANKIVILNNRDQNQLSADLKSLVIKAAENLNVKLDLNGVNKFFYNKFKSGRVSSQILLEIIKGKVK